jgi:hypothetical protein
MALESLTKGVDENESNMFWFKVDQMYDPLRNDPRFQDLLLRMNLEP